ncbi:unnamed protein product [Haemonchus placei]|uniref:G_PROTEIN_RECEP_F1_2 domain-containing protein n=1 Tax=Haemonchus placei TaxID=6290 RepID=A0A0N4W0H0_HAEPC|nr:unnamed protein product [Haemonchus placei]
MLTRPYLNYFPKVLCHPYYVTIWTIQLVSCLNLVWLNVDKLIFIQFPLHYYSIINRRKVFIVSVVTWIVLGYIAFAVNAFMTISGGCDRVIINPYIYMPICVLYVVMILTSFIISAIIYFIAHTSTRSETRQRTNCLTIMRILPFTRQKKQKSRIPGAPCRSEMVHQMTDAFFRILVVGMVINPLITIWTQRIYRMHLLKFFNKWQDTRDDTEVSVRRHSTKLNMVESTPLTTAL